MTRRRLLAAVAGVALVGVAAAGTRAAETTNDPSRRMYVKFSRPVALPGVALGAGVYLFELPDPVGASDVVRVSSQDRRMVYFTAFTRIVERPVYDLEQPVSFGEAPASQPQPITAWWPAGAPTGREFIYQ